MLLHRDIRSIAQEMLGDQPLTPDIERLLCGWQKAYWAVGGGPINPSALAAVLAPHINLNGTLREPVTETASTEPEPEPEPEADWTSVDGEIIYCKGRFGRIRRGKVLGEADQGLRVWLEDDPAPTVVKLSSLVEEPI